MKSSKILRALAMIRNRRARLEGSKKELPNRMKKGAFILLAMLSIPLAAIALFAPSIFSYSVRELPDVDILESLFAPEIGALARPSRLFDRNGELIALLAPPDQQEREYVNFEYLQEIPTWSAGSFEELLVVFAEDRNLFISLDHSVSLSLANKFLLANEEAGFWKNIRGNLLALMIGQNYSQKMIGEWAINSIHFGNYLVGIGSASQYYFGKNASSFNLAEIHFLIALAQLNQEYQSDWDSEDLIERQQAMLNSLNANGSITLSELDIARLFQIEWQHDPAPNSIAWPAHIQFALEELELTIDSDRLSAGGLDIITTYDQLLQQQLKDLSPEGSESILLDPQSGQVIAFISPEGEYFHAPGSFLSIFVYLSAFANEIAPASLMWDIPSETLPQLLLDKQVETFLGPISARRALANNLPSPTNHLLAQVGYENVWNLARQSGLSNLIWESQCQDNNLLFEGGKISLIQAAQAMALFANEGNLIGMDINGDIQASSILYVRDHEGNILMRPTDNNEKAISSAELAYLVNDVLADSSSRNSGALEIYNMINSPNIAIHAGGTLSKDSNWAFAYSPNFVIGLWSDDFDQLQRTSAEIFDFAIQHFPPSHWEQPTGISTEIVCVPSGQLPGKYCPEKRKEIFLDGFVPQQSDDLFSVLRINSQSQLLATVFSPLDQIIETPFLNFPEEARVWALANGIPEPPTEYDSFLAPQAISENTIISSPIFLGHISGVLNIRGSVRGEDFEEYRILIGAGPNPEHWLEIGKGSDPKSNDLLLSYDVSEIEGLFSVQIQNIQSDGSVENAYTMISVDNQPPILNSISIQEDQIITQKDAQDFLIEFLASDNIGIALLELTLDGNYLGDFSRSTRPFPLTFSLGSHELQVSIKDAAGNRTERFFSFYVSPD